ncbi:MULTISPECIES: hypothetical protein [unclassified Microcoleus]|uniref:hypothetical protein n=1 Tax=unclassified Microcoleus TaxID=2642155 RepID=UPI002FD754AE
MQEDFGFEAIVSTPDGLSVLPEVDTTKGTAPCPRIDGAGETIALSKPASQQRLNAKQRYDIKG